jgi:predicted nucleic acid-binding Zn ribbon protein
MLSKGRVRRSTPATAKKQPLAFNTALDEFAASLGITKKLREYNVLTSWETIVGEQIAKVAKPQRIDNRILLVAVASAPWRTELSMRRREIMEKINAAVGKKVLQDIRFR